ncbi:MAG: DUF4446 family protein [Actinomycetota bacterium]|nr:DUF4446 family protein [Actinomycetota bacterium]
MPDLSSTNTILAALAGLTLLLLVWVILLSLAVRRQNRAKLKVVKALKGETDIMEIIAKSLDDIESLSARQEQLTATGLEHRAMLSEAVRRVGVVRYDAFPEVGGRLSFSAALLNEGGDGVIITSISGRSDSRVYAKPIVDRRSTYPLSGEEEQAMAEAFKGARL